MPWPEPSTRDHNAPWNDDGEGGCACDSCRKAARDEAKEDRDDDDR